MPEFEEKYINPFTDYGFKRIFGEEPNKDLLLDFINEILKEEQGKITELTYLNAEKLGRKKEDRKAVFDIYCTNERGEKFIVELQATKQTYFKDRTVYYSTFPIIDQARKGANWNYELQRVYTIAILDFIFNENKEKKDKFRSDVKLMDTTTHEVFYDKLMFIYFEMPKYNKTLEELETNYDKWLYVLKNLDKFDRIPDQLKTKIFMKLFNVAEVAKFNEEEQRQYRESLKVYRDLKNSLDTAREEGREEGMEEGMEKERLQQEKERLQEKRQTVKTLAKNGVAVEIIMQVTGFSMNEIENILSENG